MKLRKGIACMFLAGIMSVSCVLGGCAKEEPAAPQEQQTAPEAPKAEAEQPEAGETIKIGVVSPMTGGSADLAKKINWGIQMAVDEKNENGGITSMDGRKIEIVYGDSTGAPDVGATEAERLIVSEKCDVILTTTQSNVSASVAAIAEKYQKPCILVTSVANTILQEGYEYVFRFNHYGSLDARVCSSFIQELGVKSVAIVYEDTDWGKGLVTNISPLLEGKIEILAEESYASGASDFSSIVNKLKSLGPDSVIAVSYTNDAVLLAKTMKEYGCDIPITAASGVFTTSETIELAGDAVEYVFDINNMPSELIAIKGEEAKRLNEMYKTGYSGGMDLDQFPVCGWMSTEVLFDALERAGSTEAGALKDALKATNLDSSSYPCTLSPYGGVNAGEIDGMTNQNTLSDSTVCQVQNGETKIVWPSSLKAEDTEIVWPVPGWSER